MHATQHTTAIHHWSISTLGKKGVGVLAFELEAGTAMLRGGAATFFWRCHSRWCHHLLWAFLPPLTLSLPKLTSVIFCRFLFRGFFQADGLLRQVWPL